MSESTDITDRLEALGPDADAARVEELLPVVYDELRSLAAHHLRHERSDHTLQPTALVNEVYLKLVDVSRATWRSHEHFMAIAARAIRRILVDHARTKKREKRGGGAPLLALDTSLVAASESDVDILALDEALTKLGKIEPEKARVVELRFFAEMTEEQVARVLGVTVRTVRRHWEFARTWLYRELSRGEGAG